MKSPTDFHTQLPRLVKMESAEGQVVYTHVNNLRGKIEENASQPRHIVSLRVQGYRFDV